MPERMLVCPNCETVMDLHYDPSEVEVAWYQCSICGHQAEADAFRPLDEDSRHFWHQQER